MEGFKGWDYWKEKNKIGFDSEVLIERKDNLITVTTQNLGISIKNVTTIFEKTEDVYLSLTGDQCALTNIQIIRSE